MDPTRWLLELTGLGLLTVYFFLSGWRPRTRATAPRDPNMVNAPPGCAGDDNAALRFGPPVRVRWRVAVGGLCATLLLVDLIGFTRRGFQAGGQLGWLPTRWVLAEAAGGTGPRRRDALQELWVRARLQRLNTDQTGRMADACLAVLEDPWADEELQTARWLLKSLADHDALTGPQWSRYATGLCAPSVEIPPLVPLAEPAELRIVQRSRKGFALGELRWRRLTCDGAEVDLEPPANQELADSVPYRWRAVVPARLPAFTTPGEHAVRVEYDVHVFPGDPTTFSNGRAVTFVREQSVRAVAADSLIAAIDAALDDCWQVQDLAIGVRGQLHLALRPRGPMPCDVELTAALPNSPGAPPRKARAGCTGTIWLDMPAPPSSTERVSLTVALRGRLAVLPDNTPTEFVRDYQFEQVPIKPRPVRLPGEAGIDPADNRPP